MCVIVTLHKDLLLTFYMINNYFKMLSIGSRKLAHLRSAGSLANNHLTIQLEIEYSNQ